MPQQVQHFLAAEKQSETQAIWVASQPFHGWSDPGTVIGFVVERDSSPGPAEATMTVTGYFVNQ